jgi:hypothetical protein
MWLMRLWRIVQLVTNTSAQMLTSHIICNSQNVKQFKCPLTEEQTKFGISMLWGELCLKKRYVKILLIP